MRKDLMISGAYIAAIIGAGFASGSEIVYYFAVHGRWGFAGIILSSFLFGIMAWAILDISRKTQSRSFSDIINLMFGKRLAFFINIFISIFMLIVYAAMAAGCGESLKELIGTNKLSGVILILAVTAIILAFDVRGFMAANGFMAVLIIAGTLGVCMYLFNFREINVFNADVKWVASGAAYAGYNILTASAVLPPMSEFCENDKRVGIVSGGMIFVLLGVLWGIISIYYGKINLGTFPMLTLCKRHGRTLGGIYSAVLFAAMLTTAVANAFALNDSVKGKKFCKIGFITALGFLLSGLNFGFFIEHIYRYAGYAGVIFMIYIIMKKIVQK